MEHKAKLGYRIISTYVENTYKNSNLLGTLEDHLHIRGEHKFFSDSAGKNKGSSPHTWRTQRDAPTPKEKERIISTYVENTNYF